MHVSGAPAATRPLTLGFQQNLNRLSGWGAQDQGGLAPQGGEAREAPLFGAVVGRVTGQIHGGRFEVGPWHLNTCACCAPAEGEV